MSNNFIFGYDNYNFLNSGVKNNNIDALKQISSEQIQNKDTIDLSKNVKEKFANINGNLTPDLANIVLQEIATALEQREVENTVQEKSKTGLGALANKVIGLFGKGTKGENKKIKELKSLYNKVLKNPTQTNINELYAKVFGENLDINEIKEVQLASSKLQNGKYTLENGQTISMADIAKSLSEQAEALDESFNKTVESEGVISKGLSWLNNNLLGLGQTKNMTKAQMKEYKNLTQKLNETKDPVEFASIFKQITGEELTDKSITSLAGGTSMVENSKAAEAMMDYERTQKVALTTASAIAIGMVTAATGPIGGLAIGAGMNVGIKGLDTATRNNGKGVLGNLKEYAQHDLIKDAAVGAINGFSNVIGNKAGAAIKGIVKEPASKLLLVSTRIAGEFVEGASDGAISNAGEYIIDVATGDAKFSKDELKKRTQLGAVMGGVFSVGMQEGIHAIGGLVGAKAVGEGIDGGKSLDTSTPKASDTDILGKSNAAAGIPSKPTTPDAPPSSTKTAPDIQSKNKAPTSDTSTIHDIDTAGARKVASTNPTDALKGADNVRTVEPFTGDYSDTAEFAAYFERMISSKLKVRSTAEVQAIIDAISAETGVDKEIVTAVMGRLTQFSSYADLTEIGDWMVRNNIGDIYQKSGLSLNDVMYYVGKKKHQLLKDGKIPYTSKQVFFIDSYGLDFLQHLKETNLKEFESFRQAVEKQNIRLATIEGWNIKAGDSKVTGGIFSGEADIVDLIREFSIKAQQSGGKNCDLDALLNDDIITQTKSILGQDTPIEVLRSSSASKLTDAASISQSMKPNMPDKFEIQATIDTLIEKRFYDPNGKLLPGFTEAKVKRARANLARYYETMFTGYSSDTITDLLKGKHRLIQREVVDHLGKSMDDVYYVIPTTQKSFDLLQYQYFKSNGIDRSRILYQQTTGQFDCFTDIHGTKVDPAQLSNKVLVVTDDIVGGGSTMVSQEFKYKDIKLYPEFSDTTILFDPLVSTKTGLDTINYNIHQFGTKAGDKIIDCEIVDAGKFFATISDRDELTELKLILGSSGVGNVYAATAMPYMIPDNCSTAAGYLLDFFLNNSNLDANKVYIDQSILKQIKDLAEKLKSQAP